MPQPPHTAICCTWAGLGWAGLPAALDHRAWLGWTGRLIILCLDQKESATEMRTHLMAPFDTVEQTLSELDGKIFFQQSDIFTLLLEKIKCVMANLL